MEDDYQLGLAAFGRRDLAESERRARAVLASDPDHADAWQLLGVTAYEAGDPGAAVECLVRAIERDALKAEYFYNLALAYTATEGRELAVANYYTAIALDGNNASAHANLVSELRADGRVDDAVGVLEKAVAAFPDDARFTVLLAKALRDQGRVEEAFAEVSHAVRLDPGSPSVRSEELFLRQYQPGVTPESLLESHRTWDETQPEHEPRFVRASEPSDGRLRIGFLSPDLGYHPVGLFLAPVLERLGEHDVEAFCYSHRSKIDDQSRRLANASTFLDVRRMNDDAIAQRIAGDRIDVLFDLAGHTDDNRLPVLTRRPAPVQITWAGYVGTTGLRAIDHLLADRFHVPEGAEANYTENVLRMPHGYVCYEPPEYAPAVDPRPVRGGDHVVFGCFNNSSKMNDAVVAAWSRILSRVPGSRLVLKYTGCDQPVFRERVNRAMRQENVDPGRVEYRGRTLHVEHLRQLGQVDIALDPFPYSGGLSTLEAVWMGVPVVTRPGETFASRHSWSHLVNAHAVDEHDPVPLVANSVDDYVDSAFRLANDTDTLAEYHSELRERMHGSPVCDGDEFVRSLVTLLTGLTTARECD